MLFLRERIIMSPACPANQAFITTTQKAPAHHFQLKVAAAEFCIMKTQRRGRILDTLFLFVRKIPTTFFQEKFPQICLSKYKLACLGLNKLLFVYRN